MSQQQLSVAQLSLLTESAVDQSQQQQQLGSQPAAADNSVLTNVPPPAVSKPSERLLPLDLQPFVRYTNGCVFYLAIIVAKRYVLSKNCLKKQIHSVVPVWTPL